MDLKGFFRSLSPEVLVQYRQRYEDGEEASAPLAPTSADALEALADRMAVRIADRQAVRDLLKGMDKNHHVALIALLQCGGVAGGTWLLQELTQTNGLSEDQWATVLHDLGLSLLLFGNSRQSPPLFYIVPEPIARELTHQFRKRLGLLGSQEDDEIRLSRNTNYHHPVGFSLISLLTYLRQTRVRITRGDEIFKKHHDDMLLFFASLWGEGEEKVLAWHLDMLRELGLTQQRGGFLEVDDLALQEFLAMAPRERRDLYQTSFLRREPLLGWVMDALSAVDEPGWVPIKRLRMLYRRRYMGDVFHRRYVQKSYYLPPSGFYDPNPPLEMLQLAGLIESGLSASGSHVRLSESGRAFVGGDGFERLESSEAMRFFLQPTFDLLAPIGMPLDQLWKLGQMCSLRRVDRASTYTLTRESVRSALDEGWRAEDLQRFLREGSAVAVPQNVASTLCDWVGRHGEIELHDALVVTAAAHRVDDLLRVLSGFDLPWERLGDRVVAIPRELREEVLAALREAGLDPAGRVRHHDLSDDPRRRRGALHTMLDEAVAPAATEDEGTFPSRALVALGAPAAEGGTEAMHARGSRGGRTGANRVGADLSVKPAAAGAGDLLRLSPGKTILVIKAAIRLSLDVDILYPSTGDEDPGGLTRVTPDGVEEQGGGSSFSGQNLRLGQHMKFQIKRIQGIRLAN